MIVKAEYVGKYGQLRFVGNILPQEFVILRHIAERMGVKIIMKLIPGSYRKHVMLDNRLIAVYVPKDVDVDALLMEYVTTLALDRADWF